MKCTHAAPSRQVQHSDALMDRSHRVKSASRSRPVPASSDGREFMTRESDRGTALPEAAEPEPAAAAGAEPRRDDHADGTTGLPGLLLRADWSPFLEPLEPEPLGIDEGVVVLGGGLGGG